jgi:hypothetical protein
MKDSYVLQTKQYSNYASDGMLHTLCNNTSNRPRSINKVKNVDFNMLKLKRCGIVPFCFKDNDVIFYLGVDTKTDEITDFGGSINISIRETPIQCAIREFKEESLDTFDDQCLLNINECLCVHDIYRIVIFVNVPNKDYSDIFNKKKELIETPLEVKDIVSFNSHEFKLLSKGKMSAKLYRILINFFKTFSIICRWLPFLYNNTNNVFSVTQDSTNSLNTII